MLSYAIGLLACALFLYNPLSQLLGVQQPSPTRSPQIRRIPRPRINESLLALDDWPGNLTCLDGNGGGYRVHLFSKEPLVVYLEGFLSAAERAHLLDISEPAFEPATITHNGGANTQRDQTVRDSEVAVIPRTEQVRCIESRARAFQGWREEQWIERLRTQRYGPGGHYNHHFDWSSSYGGWGRVTSFMVWVDGSSDDQIDPVKGGGTEFPLLKRPSLDKRWCRFIECDAHGGAGGEDSSDDERNGHAKNRAIGDQTEDDVRSGPKAVVFKPIAGNAVYWENFRPDGTGRGWDETWHAGLPVEQGTKVGLNIWTWGRID